jgi:hypothetical protein
MRATPVTKPTHRAAVTHARRDCAHPPNRDGELRAC